MTKILLLVCLFVKCALATAGSSINIIVPSTPGGAPDLVARAVGEVLRAKLQVEVLVQHVPGANGELAVRSFMRASPESNALLVAQDSVLVINPHLYQRDVSLPQQVGKPLAYLGYNDSYLLLRTDHSANSLEDLLRLARHADKPLFYGTGGTGSLAHLVAEELSLVSGSTMLHVPYKSNSEALVGLLRGDVEMIISGSAALPMLRSQRVKAVAVIGSEPSKLIPTLPQVSDSYPGIAFNPWFGVLAQQSASPTFIKTVSAALQSGWQEPAVQVNLLEQGGITARYLPPQEFLRVLKKDHARYGQLTQRLSLQKANP